ncbi:hypothetical protein PPACK8108_LOCUS3910 [Phakopsora pachyrhizi]|uniref:Uncharacterized protein n=1 Tax=Phakopsora pachyrhizi TaxID=170000 RepID=A0AAV0APS0_PHAPC|nr:hypothetical protein PPACK8108_LOCUS3910 [Phakopsora pachyrhizi]
MRVVVEDLVKEDDGKEVKGGFCWILLGFEEEGNGWQHWKEEQKLGQSSWSKTTGATDL